MRPHETISVYDGQPIAMMEFYRNTASPERPYGEQLKGDDKVHANNYQSQAGPKLAKFFSA